MQVGVQFSQSTPILIWGVNVPSVEAAELQGRGITVRHHLPHGGEGLAVNIKNISAEGSGTSSTGEYKYLYLVTSFSRTIFFSTM